MPAAEDTSTYIGQLTCFAPILQIKSCVESNNSVNHHQKLSISTASSLRKSICCSLQVLIITGSYNQEEPTPSPENGNFCQFPNCLQLWALLDRLSFRFCLKNSYLKYVSLFKQQESIWAKEGKPSQLSCTPHHALSFSR